MPRKRTNPDGSNDEGCRSSKRIKKENVSLETRWEWEGDGGTWTSYTADLCMQLTDALNAGKKYMELKLPTGVVLKVMFERMVQKNKVTGWDRRVRRCVKHESDEGYYSWEWEDERKNWNPYGAAVSIELEQARAGGDTSVKICTCGRNYTVSVAKLEQKNDDTDVVRSVRRIKSDATVPENESKAPVVIKTEDPGTSASVSEPSTSARKKASKSEGAIKNGRSGRSGREKEEEKSTVKTVIVKGRAPVDPECGEKVGVAHVFSQGNDVYDVMLNQTNVQNNNNKFFILQILEDDSRKLYNVWFRWGRVGLRGQSNLISCGPDLEEAKKVFCKKFSDKTKNEWADRKKFQKVPGKYDLLHIDHQVKESKKPKAAPKDIPKSRLDQQLQNLIDLICDVKVMEDAVVEMKYDSKKMPLGKLTTKQINAGYSALKIIDQCIVKKNFGSTLLQACNDFYTRIPHCFGMRTPPLIRTKDDVKAKIQMLEALADIEIAMKIIKEEGADDVNPIDSHYTSLKCDLQALDKTHPEFEIVNKYVTNTHAPTHNTYKMVVLNVFKANKEGDADRFNDVGNRMLLWHGSRLSNWVGILSQGLRIAPPEAPATGYMFGKGVYFADVSSKSANYCFATRTKNTGILLLCEVALGTTNDLLAADYTADKLPAGKHSVKGLGALAPDSNDNHIMEDGLVVPLGKCVSTGVRNPNGYTLNYNEFIVYNTSQIKMKYLVQVKFNFN